MRFKKTEREFFRKHLEIFFVKNPQIKYTEQLSTPKYTEESALKAKKRSRKLVNLLYRSGQKLLWMMKNTFVLMVITCLAVLDIIQMAKKNVLTMLDFTEMKNFLKKYLCG